MTRGENAPPPEGWALPDRPARDLLYPREWAGIEDDPENIERGVE